MINLTDAMYDFLAECWKDGISARQIGRDFAVKFPMYNGGTTKNAIVGIIGRAREQGDVRFPKRVNIGRPGPRPCKPKPPKPPKLFKPKIKVVKGQVAPPPQSKHGFLVVTGGLAPTEIVNKDAFTGTGGKPLTELNAGECHWPIGDGTPQWFCGATTTGRYCEFHLGLSHRVANQRRRS